MYGIQCFSSRPIQDGWRLTGHCVENGIEIPYMQLLTMQLSAIQWRKTNGPIKLYTDKAAGAYLEKKGILKFWDDVDTGLLEAMGREHPGIDNLAFWSAAKFICYEAERIPFACIDTDLIVWAPFQFRPDTALGCAHWECVERGDVNYPSIRTLHCPAGYHFYRGSRFCRYAANMAVTYIGLEEFRQEFVTEAFRYMENNNDIITKKGKVSPELLYMEQRLPLLIAKRRRLPVQAVMDAVWSPKQFRFIRKDSRYSGWFFAGLDKTMPFTHVWFHKEYLSRNRKERESYIDQLKRFIMETGNEPAQP